MGEEHCISLRNENQEVLASKCVSQLQYDGGPLSLANWKYRDDSNGKYIWKERETGDSYCVWNEETILAIHKALDLYFPFTVEESMAYEETKNVLEWISTVKEGYQDQKTHIVFETYYGY